MRSTWLGVGQYVMAYVTPERFQNRRFLERVQRYARHNVISTLPSTRLIA